MLLMWFNQESYCRLETQKRKKKRIAGASNSMEIQETEVNLYTCEERNSNTQWEPSSRLINLWKRTENPIQTLVNDKIQNRVKVFP